MLPASSMTCRPVVTHCWYSRLLGAMTATDRSRPARSPPAQSAGRPSSFLLAYSVDISDTEEQSGVIVQA